MKISSWNVNSVRARVTNIIDYLKISGGIFKDMMIHDFDLARYYAGKDEFESIFATGSNLYDKKLGHTI